LSKYSLGARRRRQAGMSISDVTETFRDLTRRRASIGRVIWAAVADSCDGLPPLLHAVHRLIELDQSNRSSFRYLPMAPCGAMTGASEAAIRWSRSRGSGGQRERRFGASRWNSTPGRPGTFRHVPSYPACLRRRHSRLGITSGSTSCATSCQLARKTGRAVWLPRRRPSE
jgi:hypothetical protein